MRASVPATTVDNSYETFPAGYYTGEITSVELRDPNGDGSWLVLKVAVAGITPKKGTPAPGRDRFQGDITIKTDGVDLFTVESFGNPDLPFMIRKGAGLLAGLAEGLGVAKRVNGQVEADLEAVSEALIAGEFKSNKIGFEVSNRKAKDSDKVYDGYNRFGAAD